MTIGQYNRRAVGTFSSRQDAEDALNELQRSGFPMDRVSVIARDTNQRDKMAGADVNKQSDAEAQEGAGAGAVAGTALGGIGGLLVGLEALVIPGVGPFLAAGTVATTLAGAGIGAAGGGIVGALTNLGISEDQAKAYSERISQGGYLVIVDGTDEEIRRAESVLSKRRIQDWNIYNSPNY